MDGVLDQGGLSQHPGISCPYEITLCIAKYTNPHLLGKTNMLIMAS